jgi:hypothetical protein
MLRIIVISLGILGLVGCQSQPSKPIESPKTTPPAKPTEIHTPTGVVIKPYDREEIQRQQRPIPSTAEPRVIVPQQQKTVVKDGSELPAFKNLIQKAETALNNQQLTQAENFTMQAQRLAPQAAQTYLMLSKIALLQNNKANAQALAQRGLSLAQTDQMKNQLNQVLRQAQ